MKKMILFAGTLAGVAFANAQTLFTYADKPVSKSEFISAFDKNPSAETNRKKALREYLDLYINFKLKVQAGLDEKLGMDANAKIESDNFKKQLAENAINEEANMDALIKEAFERSQKDIHLAQIFIPVAKGGDTVEAYKKVQQAYAQLQAGKAFEDVLSSSSTDISSQKNKGDLGYITVFSLPYEIENIVYGLKNGGCSTPYHSSIGYHIFERVGDRPAIGKRKIEQVLFPFVPSSSDADKKALARKADSVHQLIQTGSSFEAMQKEFGINNYPNSAGAEPFEIGVGQYNSDFEKQVFALQKDGDVSAPFATAYGYHIVKLFGTMPVSKDMNDQKTKSYFQSRIERDGRSVMAKKNLINKWLMVTKYKPATYNENVLWSYTDSSLKGRPANGSGVIDTRTVLFSFTKKNVDVKDWLQFVTPLKKSGNSLSRQPYKAIMKEFVNSECAAYYQAHLEEYNVSFREQLEEFDQANLLFAAMDKHVWAKATNDSIGLKKYYDEHASKYTWRPSVRAIVITSTKKTFADSLVYKLRNDGADIHALIGRYGDRLQVDSGRFENVHLPIKQPVRFEKGFISLPEQNGNDNSYTFIDVTDVYPQPAQRSFEEARGMVVNDYQDMLEANWIAELRKKYSVKVNDQVFSTIK